MTISLDHVGWYAATTRTAAGYRVVVPLIDPQQKAAEGGRQTRGDRQHAALLPIDKPAMTSRRSLDVPRVHDVVVERRANAR
jgi:hypothetical protein